MSILIDLGFELFVAVGLATPGLGISPNKLSCSSALFRLG